MTIEIKINETVHTIDGIVEMLNIIDPAIRSWFESGDTNPLNIQLTKKNEDRGPPSVLSIHVEDKLPVLSILR
jgi:hypothetical protein